jgi:hypothetical protein
MPRAVLRTLEAAWRADIDLLSLPANVDRFDDLLAIETRIRTHLPPARMLPRDLRDAALCRVNLAALLLGPVTLSGIVDVDPVWRPLLMVFRNIPTLSGTVIRAGRHHGSSAHTRRARPPCPQ